MYMDDEVKREVLRSMLIVRKLEEHAIEVYDDRGIPELPHSSIGQEAVGVGACHAVRDDDWIAPSLRTRAAMVDRVPLREVVAGMFGTVSGPSNGRTTQHHMGSSDARILGTTGMVGAHLNPAVGAGLSEKMRETDGVSLVFFGDGATQRGEFHTAVNFASVNSIPTVFVIENNRWTEMTQVHRVVAANDLVDQVGHKIPTRVIDGQDADVVYSVTRDAAERARSGDGPTLIEAKTHRFRAHAEAVPDPRSQEEIEGLRDPLTVYESRLVGQGIVSEEEVAGFKESAMEQVTDAFSYVESDPLPDEDIMYHVYSDTDVAPDGTVVR